VQAQLIYPQKNVAAMIAGRLSKSKGVEYKVSKLAVGFLVEPTVKPEPKTVTNFAIQAANAESAMAKIVEGLKIDGSSYFQIEMPVKSISKEWIHARHDGKAFWIAKSSLADWGVTNPGFIKLVMTNAYAKKRGLI
jgi:hypothetical protein